MERELAEHLLLVAKRFAEAKGLRLSTLGRMAAWDGRFFENLNDPAKSFTARKYDEVLAYFSAHWPDEGLEWPANVIRPDRTEWQRVLERVRTRSIGRRAAESEAA